MKSMTGSRKVIEILNRMGHLIDYHTIEELETELTYIQTTLAYFRSLFFHFRMAPIAILIFNLGPLEVFQICLRYRHNAFFMKEIFFPLFSKMITQSITGVLLILLVLQLPFQWNMLRKGRNHGKRDAREHPFYFMEFRKGEDQPHLHAILWERIRCF